MFFGPNAGCEIAEVTLLDAWPGEKVDIALSKVMKEIMWFEVLPERAIKIELLSSPNVVRWHSIMFKLS